jgi:hypothetical protein
MRLRALLCAALIAQWTIPAAADMVITADAGGSISQYAQRYALVRDSGERVVIDGLCLSACTMLLGIVPRDRVCATGNALLGFHAARLSGLSEDGDVSPIDTQRLYSLYPQQVRAWIVRHGGLKSEMIFLQGRELRSLVGGCGASRTARAAGRSPSRRAVPDDEAEIIMLANRLGL